MSGQCLQLGHDHILPSPLKFIIYHVILRQTIKSILKVNQEQTNTSKYTYSEHDVRVALGNVRTTLDSREFHCGSRNIVLVDGYTWPPHYAFVLPTFCKERKNVNCKSDHFRTFAPLVMFVLTWNHNGHVGHLILSDLVTLTTIKCEVCFSPDLATRCHTLGSISVSAPDWSRSPDSVVLSTNYESPHHLIFYLLSALMPADLIKVSIQEWCLGSTEKYVQSVGKYNWNCTNYTVA
jgi:hypothetical protein